MDRVKNCEEKFGELFGGKPTQNEGNDPEFMRILQRFIFGEVCYTGSLDNRMRELITITVLTVYGALPQLKSHTGACLNIGIPPIEIRETVYQCAPFIGFPKTLNAIAVIDEVFQANGISLPLDTCATLTEDTRYEKGSPCRRRFTAMKSDSGTRGCPAGSRDAVPDYLTAFGIGDFATRKGLPVKERELLTVVILAALGGAEMQVRAHVSGALKVGNTKEEVVCALVHAMPYMGMPRLFNALNCAKELLSE